MKKLRLTLCIAAIAAAQIASAQITNPAPYCAAGYDGGTFPGPTRYIQNVSFGTLANNTGNAQYPGDHYVYYNNITAPNLTKGNTYPLSVTHDGGNTVHFVAVYIDFNGDDDFNDAGERVLNAKFPTNTAPNPLTANVLIPLTAQTGTTRLRVVCFEDDAYTIFVNPQPDFAVPCTADNTGFLDFGETEDYNVNITGGTTGNVPDAAFGVSATTGTTATIFNFSDSSTNAPTSYTWSFTPNTLAYQGGTNNHSINPKVKFTAAGSYTVKLVVSNNAGADSVIKSNLIHIGTTGIDEVASQQVPLIYPNPAKGFVNISDEALGANISIVDLQGRVITAYKNITSGTIDITQLRSGMYFIRISKDDKLSVQKLTVSQ